jgi:hypothetical protein
MLSGMAVIPSAGACEFCPNQVKSRESNNT